MTDADRREGGRRARARTASRTRRPGAAPETLDERRYYRIGDVSRLTGVKPHVLRYWETEFRWMAPAKSRSKQRLYRKRDIEVILSRAVDKGRVFPAEKETLAELFAKDVTGLRRMIATRPAEMFAQLEPKGVSGEPDRFVDDPDVSQYVKQMHKGGDPVDTEQAKQHLAAMQLLKDDGKAETYTNDEYVAAYQRASSLIY
jgi:DNA-binding transcriptional MerR regulator